MTTKNKQQFPTPTTHAEFSMVDPLQQRHDSARLAKKVTAGAAILLAVGAGAEAKSGHDGLADLHVAAAGALASAAFMHRKVQHGALQEANLQLTERRGVPGEEELTPVPAASPTDTELAKRQELLQPLHREE